MKPTLLGLSEARPNLPSSETSESPLPLAGGSSLRQKIFCREQMNIYHRQLFFPSGPVKPTENGNCMQKEMATHLGILARRIPWTEETGRLQSMGL